VNYKVLPDNKLLGLNLGPPAARCLLHAQAGVTANVSEGSNETVWRVNRRTGPENPGEY
jgi:hypothetical protein